MCHGVVAAAACDQFPQCRHPRFTHDAGKYIDQLPVAVQRQGPFVEREAAHRLSAQRPAIVKRALHVLQGQAVSGRGHQGLTRQVEVELARRQPMPVRQISRGRRRPVQGSDCFGPAHVAVDGHLDVVGVLGVDAGRRGAGGGTRKGLQCIAISAVELSPDAQVHAVVEIDGAPLVGAPAHVAVRPTAVGDQRKPLPVDVTRFSADRFEPTSPTRAFPSSSGRSEDRNTYRPGRSTRSARRNPRRPTAPVPVTA